MSATSNPNDLDLSSNTSTAIEKEVADTHTERKILTPNLTQVSSEDTQAVSDNTLSTPVATPTSTSSGHNLNEISAKSNATKNASLHTSQSKPTRCAQVSNYLRKMKGQKDKPLPIPDILSLIIMGIASFLSIGTLSLIEYLPGSALASSDYTQVLGSFGASAILVYGLPNAPLSQPRNQVLGQIIAGVIGIACRLLIADNMDGNVGLALPVSITLCILCMAVTQSFHPPAGGTNLIMVLSPNTSKIGFGMMVPVIYGTLVMLFWAVVTCNLNPKVTFPKYWFGFKHVFGFQLGKESNKNTDIPVNVSRQNDSKLESNVGSLAAVEASARRRTSRACLCDCSCGAADD